MRKLRRALFIFCFLHSALTPAAFARLRFVLWLWSISLNPARRTAGGFLGISDDYRQQFAEWAMAEILAARLDFDTILHILAGDEYFERNKKDVARLEREVGKLVIELWDTDPIFAKYPRLRTLGRNREFEKMWAAQKQNVK